MYTKGEWKAFREMVTCGSGRIADCCYTKAHEEGEANAQLIVEAVNACIKLNPDNPLAVAQSISDLYDAKHGRVSKVEL